MLSRGDCFTVNGDCFASTATALRQTVNVLYEDMLYGECFGGTGECSHDTGD